MGPSINLISWRSVIACCSVLTCVWAQSTLDEDKALKIAAFNIQNLGAKKIANKEVLNIIIKTLARYDIVLIQEIVDKKEQVIFTVLEELNKSVGDNDEFEMIVGPRVGRTMAKEQYAYFYRKDKVVLDSSYSYHDPADAFEREPLVAIFKPTHKNKILTEFALVGIHTKPTDAVAELQHLHIVADHIESKGTKDIMILGDFNADCDYVRKKHWKSIPLWTDSKYIWLIATEIDTTVTNSNCAYDRMVVTGDKMERAVVEGSAKPFHFDEEFELDNELARAVSDHYPVEIKLNIASRVRRRRPG